jgi:hypothetical protein
MKVSITALVGILFVIWGNFNAVIFKGIGQFGFYSHGVLQMLFHTWSTGIITGQE